MRKFLTLIGLLGGLSGCGSPPPEPGASAGTAGAPVRPVYYDVQGFLNEQIQHLNTTRPAVTKAVLEDGQPAETQQTRDIRWERELTLFQEVDINRPALRDYFTVTRQQDPATGHTTETYHRKPDAYTMVEFLEVELDGQQRLRQLRAATRQDNMLLYSHRDLALSATPVGNTSRITTYHIRGVQKLILADSTRYAVRGQIQYR